MKNYKVKIDMGYKNVEVSIRGVSQRDAENYVSENLHTDEFFLMNINGKSNIIPSQSEN